MSLVKTISACGVLNLKNASNYAGFSEHSAGTWPFYFRFSLELSRLGRKGVSPFLGFGNHNLNKFFYYTESLFFFRKFSNLLVIFSLVAWLLFHFIWLSKIHIIWILIPLFIALISTSFTGILSIINYNASGWMFFPLALYAILSQNWVLAGISWFLISFGSFTCCFVGGIFTFLAVLTTQSLLPVYAFLPALIKLSFNFLPLVSMGNPKEAFLNIAKAIGLVKTSNIRYKRAENSKKLLTENNLYYAFAIIQFIFVFYHLNSSMNIYLITGFTLFILNTSFLRFADEETIWILTLSLSTAAVIQTINENNFIGLLFSYWILISPLPRIFFLPEKHLNKFVIAIRPFKPVNIKSEMDRYYDLFKNVKPGQRILMAFKEPFEYDDVFDGLRFHIEFPLYAATLKKIHLFPDWLAVYQTNYIGALNCWGNEPKEIIQNLSSWKADYTMIYQTDSDKIDTKWGKNGFTPISSKLFNGNFMSKQPVNWWLLEYSALKNNKI